MEQPNSTCGDFPFNPKPLGAWCLVERLPSPELFSKIHVPEEARKTPDRARIISVGTGILDRKTGKIFVPPELKPGLVIFIGRQGGTDLKFAGRTLTFVNFEQILGFENDPAEAPVFVNYQDVTELGLLIANTQQMLNQLMRIHESLVKHAGRAYYSWHSQK